MSQLNADTALKHRIEKINLLLTNQAVNESFDDSTDTQQLDGEGVAAESEVANGNSSRLLDTSGSNGGTVNYELVEMHLIELRKFIASSIVQWNTKMAEFFKKTKFDEEESPVGGSVPVNNFYNSNVKRDEEKTGGQLKPVKYTKQVSNMSVASLDTNTSDLTSGLIAAQPTQTESPTPAVQKSHNDSSFTAYSPVSPHATTTDEANEHNKHSSAIAIGKRFIANLMPSSAFQPLKVPFPEEEHYLLSSESKYYINDKNLSSIIAFTLSSKEYYEFEILSSKLNVSGREMNGQSGSGYGNGSGAGVNSNVLQQALQQNECDAENETVGNSGIWNENMFHFEHRKSY